MGDKPAATYEGVRAASDSSIEIAFYFEGVKCRERLKLKPTATNLKRANQHRLAVMQAIQDGTFNYAVTFPGSKRAAQLAPIASTLPVKDLLHEWLSKQDQYVKSSTLDGYRKIATNILTPAFGGLPVSELRRPALLTWCESYDVSNKRLANILSVLRMVMQYALDKEYIETNPVTEFKFRRRGTTQTDDVDPFTHDEQNLILEHAGEMRPFFQFAFWTGLRTSELIALRWENVAADCVNITHAKTTASDELEEPKTKSSRRSVVLLPPSYQALEDCVTVAKPEFVFLNPKTGKPFKGDYEVREFWVKILDAAGVRYRRPYQTRHTYASMMLSAGENPVWVAQQMGHTDFAMLVRVYARWIPKSQPDAGKKAVSIFWR